MGATLQQRFDTLAAAVGELQRERDSIELELIQMAEKNERLEMALAIMWDAYDTDSRPPHSVMKIAKECYTGGRAQSVD